MSTRVVTTVPAATEIVAALGVVPAGISHECDYPPVAASKPVVTAATDRGAFTLRRDSIESLRPDLVVCQGTCSVCAIDQATVKTELTDLSIDPQIVSIDIHCLDDLYATIEQIGAALDRDDRAAQLTATLQSRVEGITQQAAGRTRPRVAVFDWLDPLMVAGHWVPELVSLAGGLYELETVGQPARPRSWDRIREYDPEVLCLAPCGYDIEQTQETLSAVTTRPGWQQLTAVQTDSVYIIDGDHYVNRPGPRLVDTLEHFAGLIHPDHFTVPPSTVAQPLSAPAVTTVGSATPPPE